jgi:hypothetical protein
MPSVAAVNHPQPFSGMSNPTFCYYLNTFVLQLSRVIPENIENALETTVILWISSNLKLESGTLVYNVQKRSQDHHQIDDRWTFFHGLQGSPSIPHPI